MTVIFDVSYFFTQLYLSISLIYLSIYLSGLMHMDDAVSQLQVDESLISETLDEHRHHLKGALSSTKAKLKSIKNHGREAVVLRDIFDTYS